MIYFCVVNIIVLILVLILFVAGIMWLATFFYGAPYISLKKRDVERIDEAVSFQKGKWVYELGSGDAKMLIHLTEKFELHGIGIEESPALCYLSREKIERKSLQDEIKIIHDNFMHCDLSIADYVVFFLMPPIIKDLRKKLEKELKKGAIVISYTFSIPGWKPYKVIREKKGEHGRTIYVYKR